MGKGLQKVFKAIVNEILQVLPIMGESGSVVYYFIPDPSNFSEVTRFLDDIKKPWLKATMTEIKNTINDHTFLVQEPEKVEPITTIIDFGLSRIPSD